MQTPSGFIELIDSTAGVKQGCPLSPSLFASVIQILEKELVKVVNANLVWKKGMSIPALMYANDIVILSWSPAGLNRLLWAARHFTLCLHLQINTLKSVVVVFGESCRHLFFSWNGQELMIGSQHHYFGLEIYNFGDLELAWRDRLALARAASACLFAVLKFDYSLHISTPWMTVFSGAMKKELSTFSTQWFFQASIEIVIPLK